MVVLLLLGDFFLLTIEFHVDYGPTICYLNHWEKCSFCNLKIASEHVTHTALQFFALANSSVTRFGKNCVALAKV